VSREQNVALIQKLFDAFGRGDVQTILDHCKPDCEFYYPGPEVIPYTGTKRGSREIQTYFDALLNTQSNANLSIKQFVADGDTVVAIGHYKARVNSTGKPIDTPVVLIFQIEGDKVARHMALSDTAAVATSYGGAATLSHHL